MPIAQTQNKKKTFMTVTMIIVIIMTRIIITSRLFVIVGRLSLSVIYYYSHYTVVG